MSHQKDQGNVFQSLGEAAKFMKVKRQAVHLAIKKGKLHAKKQSKNWVIRQDDVIHYLKNKYNRDKRRDGEGNEIFNLKEGLYSVNQARTVLSKHLGYFPAQRLYYLLRTGQVKSLRKGAAWVIPVEEVERIIKEGDQYRYRKIS